MRETYLRGLMRERERERSTLFRGDGRLGSVGSTQPCKSGQRQRGKKATPILARVWKGIPTPLSYSLRIEQIYKNCRYMDRMIEFFLFFIF